MPVDRSSGGANSAAGRTLVIVPIYNEESHAQELMEKFRPVVDAHLVDRVICIDDGSTDLTPKILGQFAYVTVESHTKRLGCGAAIRSGFRHALAHGFDTVVVMAGNGKDDPAEIPRLLLPLREGKADYVQGSRFLVGGFSAGLPWKRRLAMRALVWMFRLCLWKRFTDCTNGFRAYRTSILRDPKLDWAQEWLGHDYELEVYLHYKVNALKYRVVEVPVSKVYRIAKDGTYSKARLADWFTGLKPVIYLRLGLKR